MSDIRIGSKRDARKALAGLLQPVMRKDWDGRDIPARGASRAAFLSPDRRVTYKVCHSEWDTPNGRDNRVEADAVAKARKSPTGRKFVVPTTTWIIDGIAVNAQPTIAATGHEFVRSYHEANGGCSISCMACDMQGDIEDAAADLGIGDMHQRNWGVLPDGTAVIIDCNY